MTGFLVLLPSGPKNTNNFQTNHTSAQAGYKAFKFVLWKSKTYYFYTQLHLMLLNCNCVVQFPEIKSEHRFTVFK